MHDHTIGYDEYRAAQTADEVYSDLQARYTIEHRNGSATV